MSCSQLKFSDRFLEAMRTKNLLEAAAEQQGSSGFSERQSDGGGGGSNDGGSQAGPTWAAALNTLRLDSSQQDALAQVRRRGNT